MSVMATAAALAYAHITKTPGVCGGKACIDGTRIRVMDIVVLHQRGMAAETMLDYYDSRPLTLAEVHSALAYYYDHKDEIDASFEEDRKAEADHQRRKDDFLSRKIG